MVYIMLHSIIRCTVNIEHSVNQLDTPGVSRGLNPQGEDTPASGIEGADVIKNYPQE